MTEFKVTKRDGANALIELSSPCCKISRPSEGHTTYEFDDADVRLREVAMELVEKIGEMVANYVNVLECDV